MKRLLFTLLLLASTPLAHAANPSFDSFVTNDFIKIPPYIYLRHTNSSGTNVFNNTLIIYTNSTIEYFVTTNFYDNSITIYTNSSVTFNGTNLATINPTIGRIPYNADGTNFLDSSLYYIDPDTVGANELKTDLMVFNPAPTQALPTGVNLLNPFEVSFMPLAASTTTPTDTQIRLSTGNGVGALLVLQNYNGDAFELLNGDALWDDPAAHVYLSGGDWKPDTIGQAMLLIGTSQGWAEIGRFGGSTNVVTESLWQYSGGYLQPVDLTQPLFWTNVVAFGATDAVLERSSNNLQFTNNAADVKLGVVNQSGKTVSLEAQSSSAVGIASGGSPSSLFLRNGADQVELFSSKWEPGTDMSIGLGDVTSARWNGAAFGGTTYISGFADTTNYARLAISYPSNTNGPIRFESQAAGSAGVPRPFNFTGSDVRISGFPLNGIGGVSPLAVAHTSECYWTNFHFTAIAAGTNSVFTVPSGYRLFLRGLIVFPATNSTTVYPGVSISGTDYRTGIVASAGTNGNTLQTVYIYEPGESVVIYTSGLLNNAMGSGLLFTNTLPIKTVKLTSFSVGNNTVYTVPASTYAIAANVGAPPPFNFSFINGTASTIHRKLYLVPSGGSVDSSTLIGEADVLSLGSGGVTITSQFVMFPGDSFVIASDSSSAGQLAFLSIMECQ